MIPKWRIQKLGCQLTIQERSVNLGSNFPQAASLEEDSSLEDKEA